MTITRDVITDLLPAYLCGEASADTRALVEEFLAGNADFARTVAASKGRSDAMLTSTPNVSPDVERDALARTRALLHRRTWTIALALFVTSLPLTFAFSDGRVTFFMLRDEPVSGVLWIAAAYLWVQLAVLRRRLRGVGL